MSDANGVNPEKDLGASNLPGQRGEGGEEIRVQRGMFGADNGGDTSGYGGLVRSVRLPGPAARPYGGWFDEVADELEGALEEQGLDVADVIEKTVVDRDELTFHVAREHLLQTVRTLRDDPALRFELCLG
ncbi:MAG TPA: NADH-quinone oxidoreductase subunit C, partial [Streptosporangiaceae bacterium]